MSFNTKLVGKQPFARIRRLNIPHLEPYRLRIWLVEVPVEKRNLVLA
jgi:hypothetical protein